MIRFCSISLFLGAAFTVYIHQAVQLKGLVAGTAEHRDSEFTFVGFPHHHTELTNADCNWKVISNKNEEHKLRSTLPNKKTKILDEVQARAAREGLCYQTGDPWELHLFSADEVAACLQGRTIYFTGDSYVQNAFIGLGEVLVPELASNEEFYNGTQRFVATELVNTTLREVHEQNPKAFPRIQLICRQECRGSETDFVMACPQCLSRHYSARDALVFGSAIHLFLNSNHSASFTLESIEAVLPEIPDLLYNFPPKIPLMELVPSHRQPLMKAFLPFHEDLMRLLRGHNVPVLDWSTITSRCTMTNCSVDGHHKTRYVNRWKAQLLLNSLCRRID